MRVIYFLVIGFLTATASIKAADGQSNNKPLNFDLIVEGTQISLQPKYEDRMSTILNNLHREGLIRNDTIQDKIENTLLFCSFITVLHQGSAQIHWQIHPSFADSACKHLFWVGRQFELAVENDFVRHLWHKMGFWLIDFYFNGDLLEPYRALLPDTYGHIDLFKTMLSKYSRNPEIDIAAATYLFLSGFNADRFIRLQLRDAPCIPFGPASIAKTRNFVKLIQSRAVPEWEGWLIKPWMPYLAEFDKIGNASQRQLTSERGCGPELSHL